MTPRTVLILLALAVTAGTGCSPTAEQLTDSQTEGPESLGPTLGSLCELTDYSSARVQGYSLVFGLAGTGSGECPAAEERYLLGHLQKIDARNHMGPDYESMTAEQIIRSRDTAVVHVSGVVPAGAPRAKAFDVQVRVVQATQTISLQGGKLLPTELRVVVPSLGGRALARQVSASAAGPIFINPFVQPGKGGSSGKAADPRRGVVLGGGRSLRDRRVGLLLLEPDWRTAQQIERRVNARFGQAGRHNVAEANDRTSITLRVPDDYRDNYQHFFALLRTVYLQDTPGYLEYKLQQLGDLAAQPQADYEGIALAWEGIGRGALLYLAELSSSANPQLAFYAARTTLYLGDLSAVDTLSVMALDEDHPRQFDAGKALLGVAGDFRARTTLVELLDTGSIRSRMLAYQGLRKAKDLRIKSLLLPGGFRLETVSSLGEDLLCVWADDDPRIVMIGQSLSARQNVFYESPDGSVIINAAGNARQFTITRRSSPGDGSGAPGSATVSSSLRLTDLVQALAAPIDRQNVQAGGVGLTFSQIAGVLDDFCTDRIVPARFILRRMDENFTRN